MRTLVPHGLRARLTLLASLVAVPLATVAIATTVQHRRATRREFGETTLRVATTIAGDQQRIVDNTQRLLVALGELPEVRRAEPDCPAVLRQFLPAHPHIVTMGIAAPDGSVRCAATPISRVPEGSWFGRVIESGRPVIGDSAPGRTPRERMFTIARPLTSGMQTTAVLFASLSYAFVEHLAAAAGVPPGSVITVLDHDFRVASRSVDGERWVGRSAPDNPLMELLRLEHRGAIETPGIDGILRLSVATPWGGAGPDEKYLVLSVLPEVAYADLDRALRLEWIALAAVSLIAAFLVARASDVLVLRPVQALAAATTRLAEGDLSARVADASGTGELHALARAFNSMAEALESEHHRRDQAESELRTARHELEQVIDAMPFFVIVAERGARNVRLNRAARAVFASVSAEELVARLALSNLERTIAGGSDAGPIARALAGETVFEPDLEIRKPGLPPTIDLWAVPLVSAGGAVHKAVIIIHDATERHALEDRVRIAGKMDAIGGLAGGIAHEFNNLLTVILGYSDELLDERGDPSLAVRSIHEAAERARVLTHQLLAFSSRQLLQPATVDLNDAIRRLAPAMRDMLGSGVELDLRLDPDAMAATVDAGQFEHVVTNLVLNARDAMASGGRFTVSTARAVLSPAQAPVAGTVPGAYVKLSFADTGIGMSAAVRARALEPFFTTKRPGSGTGLGLAMVYGIVKQSRGGITIDSEPGHGTTVAIYLPAAERPY